MLIFYNIFILEFRGKDKIFTITSATSVAFNFGTSVSEVPEDNSMSISPLLRLCNWKEQKSYEYYVQEP